MSKRMVDQANGRCRPRRRPFFPSFREIYRDHMDRHWPGVEQEGAWFGNRQSLSEAIDAAARSERQSGALHDHQCRVGRHRLAILAKMLGAQKDAIARARSFDALHGIVEAAADRIKGVGRLASYDVATRIGRYRGMAPEVIYLHAGARDGARALGIDDGSGKAPISRLPAPLNRLSPAQAEDVLCIYKRDLARLAWRGTR